MVEKNNREKSEKNSALELKKEKGNIPNMISPLLNLIDKHAKWKNVGILFISFILLMIGVYDYVIEPQFKDRSNGLEAPDSSQSTTVEELETLMTSYPQEAIDYYLTYYVVFDLIFPLVYMLFFALAFATLLKGIFSANSLFRYVALIPIVHGLIDYTENIFYIYMMSSLPNFSRGIAVIPMTISSIKWSFWPVEILILIVLLAAFVIIQIKGKLTVMNTSEKISN